MESFNYHYDRHQDLNGQVLDRNLESQKEKLENDLKREIKKLQKNRELIKNWQLNDTVEVVVTRNKLQEYRKMVEEAMEKYKEVEKSSKMKSFSNQSIMLASLEESQNLSKEAIEVIGFIEESIEEVSTQIETLELEYDKLSGKKIKKNSSVESERQEIENFLNIDKFHLERFEKIIEYIKQKQIDPNLVLKIKDDITFYLESNQEPDFIDDETLYDEIVQQAESNYKYTPDEGGFIVEEAIDPNANGTSGHETQNVSLSKQPSTTFSSHPPPPSATEKSKSKSPSPGGLPKKQLDINITTPVKTKLGISTPDMTSPEIIQKLKPASTPAKVSGEVAWSSAVGVAAAVSGAPSSSESDKATLATNDSHKAATDSNSLLNGAPEDVVKGNGDLLNIIPSTSSTTATGISQDSTKTDIISNDHPLYNYIQVLDKSGLNDSELKLFSNTDLIKVPPGIQNFIMSFTSSRKIKKEDGGDNMQTMGKLLFNSTLPNSLSTSIRKPYLPKTVQNAFYQYNPDLATNTEHKLKNDEISNGISGVNTGASISYNKPPLHLMNYQSFWNKLRAEDSFNSFTTNIKGLIDQQHQLTQSGAATNFDVINELVLVFFYGFFYGVTPLENLIAETKLFELGWKPYGIKANTQSNKLTNDEGVTSASIVEGLNPDRYYYWFRNINPTADSQDQIEFGDYQVFDLSSWEIHPKYGFRFDRSLAVPSPLSIIT